MHPVIRQAPLFLSTFPIFLSLRPSSPPSTQGSLTLRDLVLVNAPSDPKKGPNGLLTSLPWFMDMQRSVALTQCASSYPPMHTLAAPPSSSSLRSPPCPSPFPLFSQTPSLPPLSLFQLDYPHPHRATPPGVQSLQLRGVTVVVPDPELQLLFSFLTNLHGNVWMADPELGFLSSLLAMRVRVRW
jgi:hypothetical protein